MLKGRIQYIGGPKEMGKQFGPVMKQALREGGELWHERMLRDHFGPSAGNRYKYQPRKKTYLTRKMRAKGHRRPLEFTGDLKRMVLRKARYTGTKTKVNVIMDGPRYMYMYRKDLRQPDKHGELTTVTSSERAQIAKRVEEVATRELSNLKGQETTRF